MRLPDNTLSFLKGLASFDCILVQLAKGSKHSRRGWDHYEHLHKVAGGRSRLDLALRWLVQGYGVGYLPRNRLAAVDCDSPETVRRVLAFQERVGVHLPFVNTPSGGRHFIFQLPPDIDMTLLKHHVCHPKESGVPVPWDFKLGPRTLLVAPGSPKINDEGEIIGHYKAGVWLPPPVVHPNDLSPGLEILRDIKPFVKDTRPIGDRIMGAQQYLKLHAPISRGTGRRRVLHKVAVHLIAYYDLDPHLVLHLMSRSKGGHTCWSDRCTDECGQPYPWRREDLLDALYDAIEAVPPFGVKMHQHLQDRERFRQCIDLFIEILTHLPNESARQRITSAEMFERFLDFTDAPPGACHPNEVNAAIHQAITAGRIKALRPVRSSKARGYKGADVSAIYVAADVHAAMRDATAHHHDGFDF